MSSTWITPISDRVELDINSKTSKAYINVQDINRIEGNIAFIYDALNALPYDIPAQIYKIWAITGIPNTDDIARICENIKSLADHYYIPPRYARLAIIVQKKALAYRDVNDIEACLAWLYNEFVTLGRNYNTHLKFKNAPLTHAQMKAFTHERLRKDWSI